MPLLFLFRKEQASHGCQAAMIYQVAVNVSTSSPVKYGRIGTGKNASVCKVLVAQARSPEFGSPAPTQSLSYSTVFWKA